MMSLRARYRGKIHIGSGEDSEETGGGMVVFIKRKAREIHPAAFAEGRNTISRTKEAGWGHSSSVTRRTRFHSGQAAGAHFRHQDRHLLRSLTRNRSGTVQERLNGRTMTVISHKIGHTSLVYRWSGGGSLPLGRRRRG